MTTTATATAVAVALPEKREISIFCDSETGKASVRIFKYRNYNYKGGSVFDIGKEMDFFKLLEKFIFNHCVSMSEEEKENFSLWKPENEKVITYILEIKKEERV